MSFVSWQFLVFFPAVLAFYFAVPLSVRWLVLLPSSLFFFLALNLKHGLILAWVILASYLTGLFLSKSKSEIRRQVVFIGGLIASLAPLFVFKYGPFIGTNTSLLADFFGVRLDWTAFSFTLPLGISFFTLQSIGYIIDVYSRKQEIELNPARYTLFICFFPQLVAGPIERAARLMPQLVRPKKFEYGLFTDGLRQIGWGVFKKVVIADNMANIVDPIYANPADYSGPLLALATIAFAVQIYCDFSGYTDIAIGIAKTLGINLMKNFDRPYFAKSVREFWTRWHISLSTWFRDYLYFPLGGNRVSQLRWSLNILIVFLVSGVWHGANWTFLIWGLLHGCYMLGEKVLTPWANKAFRICGFNQDFIFVRLAQVSLTLALVCFAWIFFRASSISDATSVATGLFIGWDISREA